jgi:hypothetical protein
MATASSEHDSLDWSLADQARLTLSLIHAMLQLEEPFFAVGINIIRH